MNASINTEKGQNTGEPPSLVRKLGGDHQAPIGLRTVALFELTKGSVVLLIGVYFLYLVHKDINHEAEKLLHIVRLDPAWHISRWLLENAGKLTDKRLRFFALVAAIYFVVRVIEAVGLWYEMHWAEWFAAVSAGLYLPYEVYHLVATGITIPKASVLIANLLIVFYLVHILMVNHRKKMALKESGPDPAPVKS